MNTAEKHSPNNHNLDVVHLGVCNTCGGTNIIQAKAAGLAEEPQQPPTPASVEQIAEEAAIAEYPIDGNSREEVEVIEQNKAIYAKGFIAGYASKPSGVKDRPNVKDFFATMDEIHSELIAAPKLFAYTQALDRWLDETEPISREREYREALTQEHKK